MHTYQGTGCRIHHDPDGSGVAIVQAGGHEVTVPCADLVEFVGELVRMQRMTELEQASAHELVGLRRA